MINERDVAALHSAVEDLYPAHAQAIAREAGARTAAYIAANRIPALAKWVLRVLPAPLASRLLVRAIAKHAWTFAGSGTFGVISTSPVVLEIAKNPLAARRHYVRPSCHWHVAVFAALFSILLRKRYSAHEVTCCSAGAAACRFSISEHQMRGCTHH